jgi:hypothetical protein
MKVVSVYSNVGYDYFFLSSLHILDSRFCLEPFHTLLQAKPSGLRQYHIGLAKSHFGDWQDLNPGPHGRKPRALPLDQAAPL